MSFGMISHAREKQHERRIVLPRLGFRRPPTDRGQIVTQHNRPARLKNFHLLDGGSHENLVNIIRGRILRSAESSPMPSTKFCSRQLQRSSRLLLTSAEGSWLTRAHLDAVCCA